MTRIILCADDYGQNSYISQAIIELIEEKRLSATSCMTTSAHWLSHAKWLTPHKQSVDIGLHFNLTEGEPISSDFKMKYGRYFKSLGALIRKAYFRQLDKALLVTELNAQLDQFIKGVGQLPHFIDGHQHIHQLPIVRNALLQVYEDRLRESGCYVRCVNNPAAMWNIRNKAYLKGLIIQLCGSFALKKALTKHNIPHNSSFSGAYHFAEGQQYAAIFPKFLKAIKNNGIIMCHPGLKNRTEKDVIAPSRYDEYQYFKSNQFVRACSAQRVELSRFT